MPKPWHTFLSFVCYLNTLQPLGIYTGHVTLTAARFAKHDYRCTTSVTKLLGELDWPVLSDRCTSVAFLQSSRWSLCHFSQSSIYRDKHAALITQVLSPSLHELTFTNIRSFHVYFSIGTLCLLKSVSSNRCLQGSQLIWSTKPWHSSGKGWRPLIAGYSLKNWRMKNPWPNVSS